MIIILPFFAILIQQALCFPSFNFGFSPSSEEVVPEQFLEDLKKLVSDGRLSKNDDAMNVMLSGLLNVDLGQNPQSLEMNEHSTLSPSDPTQQLSSVAKLSSDGQNISNESSLSNQPKAPMMEIKSLFEWVELDKMIAKNPSLESVIQESPDSPQSDLKVAQVEIDSQIVENQPEENQDKGLNHPEKPDPMNPLENQSIQNDPVLKPNPETSSIAGESKIDRLLRNTFSLKKASQDEDEDIETPGFYSSSTDWMTPQTAPKEEFSKPDPGFYAHSTDWIESQNGLEEEIPKVEENENPEEKSYADHFFKFWHEFFPNPFA